MDTLQLDNALNARILAGRNLDAFSEFYDEHVVAQENDEAERPGRAAWIAGFTEMSKNIESYTSRLIANAASGDVSFSEWENEMTFTGGAPMKIAQVAVRQWKDGRVVRERFYHK